MTFNVGDSVVVVDCKNWRNYYAAGHICVCLYRGGRGAVSEVTVVEEQLLVCVSISELRDVAVPLESIVFLSEELKLDVEATLVEKVMEHEI